MKEVEGICRDFLWSGAEGGSRKASIAWSTVFLPYEYDGLGIKDFVMWNRASVLKQFWAIDKAKERLWLKWIRAYYTKGVQFLLLKFL